MLIVKLHKNVTDYKLFLYDPTFFILKSDNAVVPHITLDKPLHALYNLARATNIRMKREDLFECNLDEEYNYSECVEQHLQAKTGCQSPWRTYKGDLPKCTTMEEVMILDNAYTDMYLADQNDLVRLTGCPVPCRYQQFTLVGTPPRFELGRPYFILQFASTDLATNEEMLIYPFDSFVCEFGGSLGLFIGFSFLGILDILLSWVTNIWERFKLRQETNNSLSN